MTPAAPKPRLVLFRSSDADLPHFIQLHLQQQTDCLAQFFDVVVLHDDQDYDEVCDRHQPDLAMFDSGVYSKRTRTITGTGSHPGVPKVGLLNADAFCISRTSALSDLERWGVGTTFAISVAMAEYTPSIADRLFVWPNFVDPDLYRDYGQPKTIPVLFSGSQAAHYPWRNQMRWTVSDVFPTLVCPHQGWQSQRDTARMLHGERYARLLNAAQVAPTCGGIVKEVVRKHFELPASRTCLVTERTPALEAAGFADMENCVFADDHDVVDKLAYLFDNPDVLDKITESGFQLAHTSHTMRNRDQVFQWLQLHRSLGPGERIVQDGPFGALTAVAADGPARERVVGGGEDRRLLRAGDEELRAGHYEQAERFYRRCLNYYPIPEAALRLARSSLLRGHPDQALAWVNTNIEGTLKAYGAVDADPVDWAYLVRALLCRGDRAEAVRRAGQFAWMRHPELDRIRTLIGLTPDEPSWRRSSVHELPELDDEQWRAELTAMLTACGQEGTVAPMPAGRAAGAVLPLVAETAGQRLRRAGRAVLPGWLKARVRTVVRATSYDPFCRAIDAIAGRENISSAMIVTTASDRAVRWRPSPSKALVAALGRNPCGPLLVDGSDPSSTVDFLLVTGPGRGTLPPGRSRFVAVDHINDAGGHAVFDALRRDGDYVLVAHDPGHRDGHAIFRRLTFADDRKAVL